MSLKVGLVLGVCFLAGLSGCLGERARYDNYRIYKAISSSEEELAFLKNLEGSSDSIIFLDGVHGVGKEVKIVVAPHKVPDFLELMGINEIEYKMLDSNLQALLDDGDDVQIAPRASLYDWTKYHQLDDTYNWLRSLSYEYPGVVTVVEGGKTYQGRSILGVKISFDNGKASKPGIFLEAGIHAREWIAPATATYIINQLLTSNDESIKNLALNYDWYVFPHANPDGYVYTHTKDRMWRKTRKPYGNCFGADPNRNWGFHWNEVGASNNPCTDTYAGPSAFSDVETRSLSEYITSLKGKIQLYISFHSYSQLLLYPYGHTSELPDNVEDIRRVFNASLQGINQRYNTKYTGGNIYDAIYPASGASVDWAYGVLGIKMSFCYELRPSSNSAIVGFKLPAAQIVPTGEETLDSIKAMVAETAKLGYFSN